MLKNEAVIHPFLKLIHRAVATSKDVAVKRYAKELIKFTECLRDSLIIEQMKIKYRNEFLWGLDDQALTRSAKASAKKEEKELKQIVNSRL